MRDRRVRRTADASRSARPDQAARGVAQCNNPLTKEPKLSVAMRLLPEWAVYDHEVRDLMDRWHAAGEPPAATAPASAPASAGGKDEL